MNVLGIETSCDETAAAVVKDGRTILSNVIISSLKEHKRYGGVIPEIASRRQLEYIDAVVDQALTTAKLKLKNVHAIAMTTSPGLIGPLLVGTSFAKAISCATGKPLVAVDHIKAHVYANFLDKTKQPQLPAVGLVVSGGHTSLYHIKDIQRFRLLGETIDDAAGEAFDKVAKILGLGYPGGPVIDRLAQKGKDDNSIRFGSAPLPNTFNFSFSGTKTSVLYYCREHKNGKRFSAANVAHAFQKSIVSILVAKSIAACQKMHAKTLLVGGGVAANSFLRKCLIEETQKNGINVHFPPLELCMDNAAMIAGLGYHSLKKERKPHGARSS